MRLYELVLIFKDSLTEDKRKKLLETIKGWAKDAKITKEEGWGVKPFSYAIKKQKSGLYHFLMLESEKGLPLDFEKRIQTAEEIIRHLLVRKK